MNIEPGSDVIVRGTTASARITGVPAGTTELHFDLVFLEACDDPPVQQITARLKAPLLHDPPDTVEMHLDVRPDALPSVETPIGALRWLAVATAFPGRHVATAPVTVVKA